MDSQQSTQRQPQQPNFHYFIETWGVDDGSTVLSFSTTVPQYYTLRKLSSGTVDPNTGDGAFTIDDNIFQVTSGTSSIGGGYGSVSYTTGRDAIVIQTLLNLHGSDPSFFLHRFERSIIRGSTHRSIVASGGI